MFDGRPVIGICNTWSELTPCNGHFRELAEFVKRGVYEAGGFPLEFPVMSLGETQLRPTAMLFRNLASMDVEESIRGNPIDGVVLLMGCDKTTPALLMGAASCDLPTIGVSGGPMLTGRFRGKQIGSGTGVWQMSEEVRAGKMTQEEFTAAESCMHRSKGHCMTMGTASTMASMVEALGVSLPGNAAIPAVDSRRYRLAQLDGPPHRRDGARRSGAVEDPDARALRERDPANAAIGGSTNAVIHLLAIAGRIGVKLELDDWDRLGSTLPCLVNLQPSGEFLMEDFYYAGGLPAVMREIAHVLNTDALTANGKTIGENIANAPCWNRDVIKAVRRAVQGERRHRRPARQPRARRRGDQAVRRDADLLKHRGRAVVFETIEDFKAKHRRRDLDIDETLRHGAEELRAAGLSGHGRGRQHAAAAEGAAQGHHGHGAHLRCAHERHGVRHRGAARLARSGGGRAARARAERRHDRSSTCAARRLHLDVSDAELAKRRAAWTGARAPKRGWYKLYVETRAAGGPGRGSRFPGRRERHDRPARLALSITRAARTSDCLAAGSSSPG